jgi:hypothetical protein
MILPSLVFFKTDWTGTGMGWILMLTDDSDASTVALALLHSEGTCNFDVIMNGACLRPLFHSALTAVLNVSATIIPSSERLVAVAGPSVRTGNLSGVLNSFGSATAAPSRSKILEYPKPEYTPDSVPDYDPDTKPEYTPDSMPNYDPDTKPEYTPDSVPDYDPDYDPDYAAEPDYDLDAAPEADYNPAPDPKYAEPESDSIPEYGSEADYPPARALTVDKARSVGGGSTEKKSWWLVLLNKNYTLNEENHHSLSI